MKKLPKALSVLLAFVMVTATCFGCGTESAHVHTYTEVAAAQATCTERGNVEYYKCDCGKTFVKRGGEYVEASSGEIFTEPLGHAFTKRVKEIEATCTENGGYFMRLWNPSDETETARVTVGKLKKTINVSPYEIVSLKIGDEITVSHDEITT